MTYPWVFYIYLKLTLKPVGTYFHLPITIYEHALVPRPGVSENNSISIYVPSRGVIRTVPAVNLTTNQTPIAVGVSENGLKNSTLVPHHHYFYIFRIQSEYH